MKTSSMRLKDVQTVYSGAEGKLWEFVMGEQIHIGGMVSSLDLAKKANITPEMAGVDFCCCSGAGVRFLLKIINVAHMTGVDATPYQLELFKERCAAVGLADRAECVLSTVEKTPLPAAAYDFVWGEDAWVYVEDKDALVAEAARLIKKGGVIAFTDWVEGPCEMTAEEADRFLAFMKFPNLCNIEDYKQLMTRHGFAVKHAEDTGRYIPCIDLYLRMLNEQHTFDALRIINFDMPLMNALAGEMQFIQKLAAEHKIIQALFCGIRE